MKPTTSRKARGGGAGTRQWPRFDLREDLRRDVQKAHKRIDRLVARGDRMRSRFRRDRDVRWLDKAESIGMADALADYRRAAARAATLNRFYNLARRYARVDTCEGHVLELIRRTTGARTLDGKALTAATRFAQALHRYVHVDATQDNDRAVRLAWKRLGVVLVERDAASDDLFDIPV